MIIQRVVSSCPCLRDLVIDGNMGDDDQSSDEMMAASLLALKQCSGLKQLGFGGVVVTGRLTWRALAQLTRLQSLDVLCMDAADLSRSLRLTACRELTRLCLQILDGQGDASVELSNKVWRACSLCCFVVCTMMTQFAMGVVTTLLKLALQPIHCQQQQLQYCGACHGNRRPHYYSCDMTVTRLTAVACQARPVVWPAKSLQHGWWW